MNYKERIAALNDFKSAISGGDTTDDISGVSSDVADWEGNAYTKFGDYIKTVKTDSADIAGKKTAFLGEIDGRIAEVQAMFDTEVALNKWRLSMIHDAKNPTNNKNLIRSSINQADMDSSVRDYLLSMVY